jgi:transcriptional repressor NrdR
LQCPYCKAMDTRVLDSRLASGGTVTWRRRACDACTRRFTTYERVEHQLPAVVKRDGQRQAYDRHKVLRSLEVACSKRAITREALDEVTEAIESELALSGDKEVASLVIGQKVMDRLKNLDEVAYVRFASVYKSFRDIDEFMREVGSLVRTKPEQQD